MKRLLFALTLAISHASGALGAQMQSFDRCAFFYHIDH